MWPEIEGWGQADRFQLALKSDPAGMKAKAESGAGCTESSPQDWGRGGHLAAYAHPEPRARAPTLHAL